MHRYTYTSVKALHDQRLREYGVSETPIEPARHGIRERIGHNLINLGERLARVDRDQKLGEAA